MADPYKGFYDASFEKKTDDAGLNDWLELQEQANVHDRQMKELVASHVEDLQHSLSRAKPAMACGIHRNMNSANKTTRWKQATMGQPTLLRMNMGLVPKT